jgi:hypothetical protein
MKYTISIVTAAFAGLVSAGPFFSPSLPEQPLEHATPPASDRGFPTVSIDLAGFQSWDAAGSPLNDRLSVYVGANFTVTALGWENVVIETFGKSWLSEARINFLNNPVGLSLGPGFEDAFSGVGGPYSSGGLLDLASFDPAYPFQVGADGMLHLEFFDSFDDAIGAPDAVWLSGTLTIGVPTPGSLAGLTAGIALAARRRR